nr:YegP family protein [Oricola indica]
MTKEEEGSGYRWEIAGSKDGQFYNRFVASNGETMVRSETYTDKRNAIGCAESVSKNSPDAAVEDES